MQCRRLALRASMLRGVSLPPRGTAAGVGGRARRQTARARAGLPRHAAHAGAGQRARRYQHTAHQEPAYTSQVHSS